METKAVTRLKLTTRMSYADFVRRDAEESSS